MGETSGSWWRIVEVSSLVVFTLLQVFGRILVRLAHRESRKHGIFFLASTIVLATEVFKILFSCILIPIQHKSFTRLFTSIYDSFTVNRMETLKICLPALIYVIQNNLYFFALQRIDATLFSLTYQLQILTTAVLMMVILGRRFSLLQWFALFITLAGAVIVQLGGHHTHHEPHLPTNIRGPIISDQVAGLSAVLLMCFTNALGGVYLEAVMKKSGEDIFIQNFRLGLVSLPMAALSMFSEFETIRELGFFAGWNYLGWIIIIISAFGGIMVSSVIRYADNIKKSFCQAIALGGTACVAILLGDSEFSFYLLVGVTLVIISVVLYAAAPTKPNTQRNGDDENGDKVLPTVATQKC